MLIIVTTLLVFIITLLLVLNWQRLNYWKSKGVETPFSLPFIGHFHKLVYGKRWDNVDKMYYEHKSTGYWGIYEMWKPSLYISSPDLIREILVKEGNQHFMDRRSAKMCGDEKLFNEMLTGLTGEKWKSLRSLVSPTFSSGKIKAMFSLIGETGDEFVNQCEKEMQNKSYVNIAELLGYYSVDVIATCAFGIDAHSLQIRDESEFIKNFKNFLIFNILKIIKIMIFLIIPKLYYALGLQINGGTMGYLTKTVNDTIELRKKSGVNRGDFLDLMLETLEDFQNKRKDIQYPMTMDTVIATSILFLLAGFDTTSNGISFMTYFLAKYPDEQKKIREELKKAIEEDGELNYHNVMEAQYLEAFISESLRLYSPGFFIERACTKSYKLPGTDVEIPENMIVGVPVWSLHRDPEYWEDPLSFKPERFLPENKANIKPYTYMPFGLGPRNCVGMRFAQLNVKMALAKLCLNFEMSLRPGHTELKLDNNAMKGMRPDKDGIELVLKRITPTSS